MIALPLAGRRVLVTRALEDSPAWAARLTALGAEPVILPCIRTELLNDAVTRAALASALPGADWLCVMSPRGAEALAALAAPLAEALHIAAVGEATAAAVRASLGRAAHVARGGTSRALAEELLAGTLGPLPAAARVVVAAARGGRTDAEALLASAGVSVLRVDLYSTIPAARTEPPVDLDAEGIADVILASPSAVEGLLNRTLSPAHARIFTIGPTTSAAVVAAGLSVSGEAKHPDLDSLLEAMQ